MHALAIPLLLAVGSLLALQAAANVQLSAATGSPFGAATIQLAIGATLLLAATAAAGALGAFGLLGDAPGWHLIGGLASALYITSGILLFPRLGALLTSASGSRARCSPRSPWTASAGSAWSATRRAWRKRSGPRR